MSKFNHKYKQLCDAIGLEQDRSDYLKQLCKKAIQETSYMSEAIEKVLEEGLSVIEVMFCGHFLGYNDALQNNRSNDQIMRAVMMGPDGEPIDIPGPVAQKLKEMIDKLRKSKGRLESDDQAPDNG